MWLDFYDVKLKPFEESNDDIPDSINNSNENV